MQEKEGEKSTFLQRRFGTERIGADTFQPLSNRCTFVAFVVYSEYVTGPEFVTDPEFAPRGNSGKDLRRGHWWKRNRVK